MKQQKHLRDIVITSAAKSLGLSIGIPVLSAVVAVILIERGTILNAAPIFLVGVILAATQGGGRIGFAAAVASFLLFNFFLVEPRFTFQLVSPDDYLSLFVFLATAVTVGHFAGQARDRGQAAIEKAKQLEALFEAACRVLVCKDPSMVYQVVLDTAERVSPLGWRLATAQDEAKPEQTEVEVSNDALDQQGVGQRRLQTPILEIRGPAEIVHIRPALTRQVSAGTEKSLEMLEKLAEGALARIQLQQELEDAKIEAAAESLRATIINSVAHDFRTPLSSIAASAATLEYHHAAVPESEKINLARSIRVGAERLSRFVSKLLTAAQIDSGAVRAQLQLVEVRDLLSGVLEAFALHHHRTTVQWDGSGSDSEIYCDPVLVDQALYNIVENCLDYSPAGEPVTISVRKGEALQILVEDSGPGIPTQLREFIFERWSRAHQPSKSRTGLGLGLSIAQGFIHAVGGEVRVIDKPDGSRGACFLLEFPL